MWVKNPTGRIVEVPDSFWAEKGLESQGYEKMDIQVRPEVIGADARRRSYDVSIIIMAWNRLEMTVKCLDSIFEHTSCDYELILVDNGSKDGTPEYFKELAEKRPNITLVLNETNRGVAGGRNDGIKAAKGRYLAFFDNDSTVGPDWDKIMLEIFLHNPSVGFVGRLGTTFFDFNQPGMRLMSPENDPIQVDVVSGGATMIRREVFHEVGLLDEWGMGEFWHEDSELCLRASLAGWHSYTVKFPWEHKYHSTYKDEKGKAWFDKFQSNLDYIKKKINKNNTITVYRDYHGDDCMESLCICTTNVVAKLREKGWNVIRKPTKKIVPMGLRICTGNVMEYKGKQHWWVHQENDVCQKSWLEPLKEADLINPPSPFCGENLIRSGVPKEKVIDLSPNGLDKNIYNPKVVPAIQFADTFFLFANGATQPRKGTDVLLKAYFEEFTGSDNIVLFFKDGNYGHRKNTQKALADLRSKHKNPPSVIYEWNYWTPEKLAKYYRRAAVNGAFVNPHRSEGFGMCILEALCCGAPVICTGWGGNMSFCTPENTELIKSKMVHSTFHNNDQEPYYGKDEKPKWAEPDKAHLKKLLRKVYNNNGKGLKKRDMEARRLLKIYDWEAVAERFHKYFLKLKNHA